MRIRLPDADAQEAFGGRLAGALGNSGGLIVFLEGNLGAGKTTLVRGILRGLGYEGTVKSPTYTLIEPYDIADIRCAHLDLYRLGDPEELEFLGLRDLLAGDAVVLIEWPEKGAGILPSPDLRVIIGIAGTGRDLVLEGVTDRGREIAHRLETQT